MLSNKFKKNGIYLTILGTTLQDYFVKIKKYANPMFDNTPLESLAGKGIKSLLWLNFYLREF
jgi:hypothetical protein